VTVFHHWTDYVAPITKKNLEKETGNELNEVYLDDNEALYAKLSSRATGYDVICPSDFMVHVMIMAGPLIPLDMSLTPARNVDPVPADVRPRDRRQQDGVPYR
jgi:spermidine/putrescine transport system substrate-binding protein